MRFERDLRHITNHYGYDAQSRQCIEEMAELTKALNKYWRKQMDCGAKPFTDAPYGIQEKMDILEEIADVQIMLWQMQIFHGVSESTLGEVIASKIRRQLGRIVEGKKKSQNENKPKMTRAEINAKYGIVRLMPPDVANQELSAEEAKKYEKMTKALVDNFNYYFNDDYSDDVD